MRDLLVGSNEQVTAWPGCSVADDTCFNVDCWFHINVSDSESLDIMTSDSGKLTPDCMRVSLRPISTT
jgi:hypothetical protein